MKAFIFDVAEHEEYGGLGLRPQWYPEGDPLDGMAAAHDILEHFPGDDGSFEGEMMAFGATLYIRADGGYITHGRSFDERADIPAEFPTLWFRHLEHAHARPIRSAPRVLDREIKARALEIALAAKRLCIAELQLGEDETHPAGFSDGDWLNIADWMAHGYMRAKRRYRRGPDSCTLAWLFKTIESDCDKLLKLAEGVGEMIRVVVNVRQAEADATLIYPQLEDY